MIDIIGLGPGDFGQLTVEALGLLKDNRPNYFRTAVHPVVIALKNEGIIFDSFDNLYETVEDFDTLYQTIAETLVEKAKNGESFVYAVPGSPLFAEQSVKNLMDGLKREDIAYTLHAGVSFVDTTMSSLEVDPIRGLQLIDAFDVSKKQLDPRSSCLITQVYNRHMASEVKLALMQLYPDDLKVTLITAAGVPGEEKIVQVPLCEIDWQEEINHLTSLYVPACENSHRDFRGLVDIMAILRSPNGCPWDKEQTHESLETSLIEEAYEVLDAIEAKDFDNLQEELGDLLFQVVFHAQLADEEGYFDIRDVVEGISTKMIRRHPHVFADPKAIETGEVLVNWDAIKQQEKHTTTLSEEMDRIPKAFTALMEAAKVQKKASKVGFDWDDPLEALRKLPEETEEVRQEIVKKNLQACEEELGDLLFAAVNVARLCKIDPEIALRKATNKFVDRFKTMEALALERGLSMEKMDLSHLDALWNEAKNLKKVKKS